MNLPGPVGAPLPARFGIWVNPSHHDDTRLPLSAVNPSGCERGDPQTSVLAALGLTVRVGFAA